MLLLDCLNEMTKIVNAPKTIKRTLLHLKIRHFPQKYPSYQYYIRFNDFGNKKKNFDESEQLI